MRINNIEVITFKSEANNVSTNGATASGWMNRNLRHTQ